uniref:Secreted protein n=1 Tax=Mycena chlorophos TaxID=658473 RepID=A0ABQ0MB42_MYCCL|nr:predicted protein [Mycena chlorophos]
MMPRTRHVCPHRGRLRILLLVASWTLSKPRRRAEEGEGRMREGRLGGLFKFNLPNIKHSISCHCVQPEVVVLPPVLSLLAVKHTQFSQTRLSPFPRTTLLATFVS